MGDVIQEFKQFSLELYLTTSIRDKAIDFLQSVLDVYTQYGQKISRKALFVCAVYISVQDNNSAHSLKMNETKIIPEITVSQLLEKANINIIEFFTITCFLKSHGSLNENIKQKLVALERKYLIVSAIYDKFESMFGEIFSVDSEAPCIDENVSSSETEVIKLLKDPKALCWMLFLIAKAKIFWHMQDLIATFHLLLCCLGGVLRFTPSFLLNPPFDAAAKTGNFQHIVQVLSNHFETVSEQVMEDAYNPWLHVETDLKIDSRLPEVSELYSIYINEYKQSGDVDESQFLTRNHHLLPQNREQSSSPRKNSPASVRRTLDTAEALNTIIFSPHNDLNQSLHSLLKKCTMDASTFIRDFMNESKAMFITEFIKAHQSRDEGLAERRFNLASKYYYIMLNALLKKEHERLDNEEFTSFIQNKEVHKSLLACCLEITLMSCGLVGSINFTPVLYGGNALTQGIIFPWILKVFNLEAFCFFNIIEIFIREAPSITMQIITHLKSIEDRILESLVWKSGSSVFGKISSCRSFHPMPVALSLWSPNKDVSQKSPVTPHTSHAINVFLNKTCRLAYNRLEKLCSLLQINNKSKEDIWVCIDHILHKKTHLLQDRHLDQIIMCCIYAVCKASEREVRFKTIISCYETLPHSSFSVYKQVLSDGKKDFIISFYNNEFYAEMEKFVLRVFSDKHQPSTSLSVSKSPVPLSPLYSLPSNKKIFVSPLQKSPFKDPNEVISRKLPTITFGSYTQPSKTLQDINGFLNMAPPPPYPDRIRGKKRLQFDSEKTDGQDIFSSARKCLKFDTPE